MTHDTWGVPGGLGWGKAVRWGSAAALIQLSADVQRLLQPQPPTATATATAPPTGPLAGPRAGELDPPGPRLGRFPVLCLHDPHDAVTPFEGSQLLADRCGPRWCNLVALPGGRHDLFANQPEAVAAEIRAFAAAVAAASTADGGGKSGGGGGKSSNPSSKRA